ncbi:MAG TPA: ABC transporter C-terminal domain-containing protein, partial [Pirellulaceae bacterium]
EPGRFRVIDGNYDTYQHFLKQGLARDARASISTAGSKPAPGALPADSRPIKDRRKRKFAYRKAAEIEQEIAERESRIEELHQLFASDEVLRDGAKVKGLKVELDGHQAALPALYEHWEEATEMN